MSSPKQTPRRQVLWSPAGLVLIVAVYFMPLGMLYVSADPRMDAVESALVVALVTGLHWLFFITAFGRSVWIGPEYIRVNDALTSTRFPLADIRKVTLDECGGAEITLRDGREVQASSHRHGPRFPFPSLRKAERAAATIRRAARLARPRRGGPVTVERSWWPSWFHPALSVLFCLTMWFVLGRINY